VNERYCLEQLVIITLECFTNSHTWAATVCSNRSTRVNVFTLISITLVWKTLTHCLHPHECITSYNNLNCHHSHWPNSLWYCTIQYLKGFSHWRETRRVWSGAVYNRRKQRWNSWKLLTSN